MLTLEGLPRGSCGRWVRAVLTGAGVCVLLICGFCFPGFFLEGTVPERFLKQMFLFSFILLFVTVLYCLT